MTKVSVTSPKTIIAAVSQKTVVQAVSQKTIVEAVAPQKVIKAEQKIVKTIAVKVIQQGPQGPPGSPATETFTHPHFLTVSARDVYYFLNPVKLVDELIVTTSNGSIRDLWQYSLTSVLWAPVASGGGGGSGDVVGPGSATDNGLARYDQTTGKLIQDSNQTLSDDGILSTLSALDYESGDGDKWRTTVDNNGNLLVTSLEFSISTFSDGISDTSQLIGSGEWQAIGTVSFTVTYNNGPPTSADVSLSGSSVAWAGDLDMGSPGFEGPTVNTEAVAYPSSRTGSIVFTLTATPADTDTETIGFSNTMRYGNSTLTQGNQTEASIEALSEVSGPNESRSQTISNIPTTANYLVFGYADALSDVLQVRMNGITASFNATRTAVAPSVQTGITNVANSAGFSETFAAITSTDTGLADSSSDFQLLTSSTAMNLLNYGITTKTDTYIESDIEGLANQEITNDNTQIWDSVTATLGQYLLFAFPVRLGTVTFWVGGFEGGFESPETVSVTNAGGFMEDYYVWRSTNSGLGATIVETK